MKEIYIVFGEDDCAFCCANRDTLWQKLSELFGGAKVRLNPTAIDDCIDFFDEYSSILYMMRRRYLPFPEAADFIRESR